MPGETSHFKIKYSEAADETKAFPTEVSKAGAETIDTALYEGNKVAAGQTYTASTNRTEGTEYEISATRAAYVVPKATSSGGTTRVSLAVEVAGVAIGSANTLAGAGAGASIVSLPFILPAGTKFKLTGENISTLKTSHVLL